MTTTKVWVSFRPDPDRPQIQIYGDPHGLKTLAAKLIELAELKQNPLGHDRIEHDHVFPGRGITLPQSIEIVLGRMDDRESGETAWFEEDLAAGKGRLIELLQRLRDPGEEDN